MTEIVNTGIPITVNTGLIPLMGKPLHWSFEPRMQNETYKALGLDFLYFPLEVENDNLKAIVDAFRYMNSPGWAVTKPNKVKVIEYLDDLDELAGKMGAVNTVVKRDGKLIGYNTDGEGFVRSLLDETGGLSIKEKTFFCFGAGGAGRACCSSLAFRNAKKIYIIDKFDDIAKGLANDINKIFAPIATFIPYEDKAKMEEAVRASDVLMNNSGVGMYPNLDETPIDQSLLNKNQICFDATYNPLKTLFLQQAEEVGCTIINGQGMSYCQGAIQIGLWSGKPEPIELMKKANDQIAAEIIASQK